MRICHVITRLIIGGAQENTILTCRGLTERGHNVTLIAGPETGPEGSLWEEAENIGCRLLRIDALRRAVNPIRDATALRRLCQAFATIQPDLVHTHSSKAGILGRLAAKRTSVPMVVHGIHGMSFNRAQSYPKRAFFRFLERRSARWTDRFVCVADAMTDQAVQAGIASADRFVTVRSGMETERFAPNATSRSQVRAKWGVADGEIVVGSIARLFDNKGYDEIIKAMPMALKENPRLRFVWIGSGSRRAVYEWRLGAMGLIDRVHFAGLLTPELIGESICGLDMLVHASRWEGLPRAVVQALLCEVPAISFDNDGAPEVVLNNETGMLVPYGDIATLADSIVTLGGDAQLRRRLGQRGRALCLSEFDWRTMVDRIESLYRELAVEKKIPWM